MDRSKRFTLFAFPDRPIHSDTNSASHGSILGRQQLRAKTKSFTFPPLTIARCVLIYTAESTGASMERTKMPNVRNGSKGDSNPDSLDCESGILPLSYHCIRANLGDRRTRHILSETYYYVLKDSVTESLIEFKHVSGWQTHTRTRIRTHTYMYISEITEQRFCYIDNESASWSSRDSSYTTYITMESIFTKYTFHTALINSLPISRVGPYVIFMLFSRHHLYQKVLLLIVHKSLRM